MVLALCKALACWNWGKPRTSQWVSTLKNIPPTFQIKIQKANNCTPNIWYNTSNMNTNDNSSRLPGHYIKLNSKQQHSASIFSVYMPLAESVAYLGILFGWGGFNKFSWGQRERGSGGGSPLVMGSGGICNLVQEISFHILNFLNFWYFKNIYDN